MTIFDPKKDLKKFIGKRCLYAKEYSKDFEHIMIYDIRDDIVKYTFDGKKIHFSDVTTFRHCDFRENPFEDSIINEKEINDEKIVSINTRIIENISEKNTKINQSECIHDWQYLELCSYPPIHQRICKKCGKTQHIPRKNTDTFGDDPEWVDGNY